MHPRVDAIRRAWWFCRLGTDMAKLVKEADELSDVAAQLNYGSSKYAHEALVLGFAAGTFYKRMTAAADQTAFVPAAAQNANANANANATVHR